MRKVGEQCIKGTPGGRKCAQVRGARDCKTLDHPWLQYVAKCYVWTWTCGDGKRDGDGQRTRKFDNEAVGILWIHCQQSLPEKQAGLTVRVLCSEHIDVAPRIGVVEEEHH